MRMSFLSSSRQPCSDGSCIEVTRKRPSGLNLRGEMRALPFQRLGIGLGIGKPERRAVVVRDREAEALGRERERADGREPRPATSRAPLPARAKACLPADQATAPAGPTATWSIQRRLASVATRLALAGGVGRHDLAVIAAGDDAAAVARRRQDGAAMDGDALRLAVARRQQRAPPRPARRRRCSLRKCMPTTPAPASTGRMRSTTEGMLLAVNAHGSCCDCPTPRTH